jgi:hypothetical protein
VAALAAWLVNDPWLGLLLGVDGFGLPRSVLATYSMAPEFPPDWLI